MDIAALDRAPQGSLHRVPRFEVGGLEIPLAYAYEIPSTRQIDLINVSSICIGTSMIVLTLVVKDSARHWGAIVAQTENICIEFPHSQLLMIDRETTTLLLMGKLVLARSWNGRAVEISQEYNAPRTNLIDSGTGVSHGPLSWVHFPW